jgi:hypothetical protein
MSTTTQTLASQLSDLSTKLAIYYLIPIYIIGVLGSIFNIIIFLRRNLRSNACSQYFISMSMTQIMLLNSTAIIKIITILTGYDLSQVVLILCKFRNYLSLPSLGLMRQFLCLISIDRWIVTTKSARLRKFSSSRVVRWMVIGSILFWFLFSIHTLVGYQISPTRGCTYLLDPDYALFYSIQIIIPSILTLVIMIVFSIFTLRNVRGGGRIQVITQNTGNLTAVASNTPQNINRRRREMQLIKLSLIQVISYVLLSVVGASFPLYSAVTSSQKKSSDQTAIESFIGNIALLLLYTYCAVGLIIC